MYRFGRSLKVCGTVHLQMLSKFLHICQCNGIFALLSNVILTKNSNKFCINHFSFANVIGAVPVLAPRTSAHTHPRMGASQGRQLSRIHASEQRRETTRTV